MANRGHRKRKNRTYGKSSRCKERNKQRQRNKKERLALSSFQVSVEGIDPSDNLSMGTGAEPQTVEIAQTAESKKAQAEMQEVIVSLLSGDEKEETGE